jgi:hypothetical protein
VDLAADLPMLELDAVLFEQALFNLLDNAAKYAAPGTTIRIQSWRDSGFVCLQVLDEGSGIPPYVNVVPGSFFNSLASALAYSGTAEPSPPKPIPLVSCSRWRNVTRSFHAEALHCGNVSATRSSRRKIPSRSALTAATPQKLFVPL